MEGAKAGGDDTAAAAGTPPPPPAAAEGGEEEEEVVEEDDEEAEAAMAEAFERLIAAAFEMVQQGKPMEAEYVLEEGAAHSGSTGGPAMPAAGRGCLLGCWWGEDGDGGLLF